MRRLADFDPVEIAHALDALDRHLAAHGSSFEALAHRIEHGEAPDHWGIRRGLEDGSIDIEELYRPR